MRILRSCRRHFGKLKPFIGEASHARASVLSTGVMRVYALRFSRCSRFSLPVPLNRDPLGVQLGRLGALRDA